MIEEKKVVLKRGLGETLTPNSMAADQNNAVFIDDAIRIQKYYEELQGSGVLGGADISTSCSLVVRINGNREGNGHMHMTLLYFSVNWQAFL